MALDFGELSWWNHRNTRCSCCAHLQHKEQKILKQQLQAEKAENDRFLEMDKLRKEIDFANLYLENLYHIMMNMEICMKSY